MADFADVARLATALPEDRGGTERQAPGPLREAITDGWLACAPPGLAGRHAAGLV